VVHQSELGCPGGVPSLTHVHVLPLERRYVPMPRVARLYGEARVRGARRPGTCVARVSNVIGYVIFLCSCIGYKRSAVDLTPRASSTERIIFQRISRASRSLTRILLRVRLHTCNPIFHESSTQWSARDFPRIFDINYQNFTFSEAISTFSGGF
jgi:hypothetical protein